jgi:hypothetical protein
LIADYGLRIAHVDNSQSAIRNHAARARLTALRAPRFKAR